MVSQGRFTRTQVRRAINVVSVQEHEAATSFSYEYNNRITSHNLVTISSVYTTTLLLAFNRDFNA